MLITSSSNSKIKHIRKLLDKKNSLKEGLFVIEGENLIEEAIKNNLLVELYLLDGCDNKFGFECDYITLDVMKSISSLPSTSRVIGVSKYINKSKLGKRVVLLDGVQDPGNVGTIIRNAVAFGVHSVVFSKGCVSPYNSKVLRSTGGMIYNINIIIDDLKNVISKLKQSNIKVYATSLKASISLENMPKSDSYGIVFGNEGNGVSNEIIDLCDKSIRIDMNKECESLNVGVSTGIVLYYMFKR